MNVNAQHMRSRAAQQDCKTARQDGGEPPRTRRTSVPFGPVLSRTPSVQTSNVKRQTFKRSNGWGLSGAYEQQEFTTAQQDWASKHRAPVERWSRVVPCGPEARQFNGNGDGPARRGLVAAAPRFGETHYTIWKCSPSTVWSRGSLSINAGTQE